MTRLIDADALHDDLKAKQKWIVKKYDGFKYDYGYTYDQVHFAIDRQPTVDAVPIEWLEEKLTGHSELPYAITDGIVNVLNLWKEEQEKQNETIVETIV